MRGWGGRSDPGVRWASTRAKASHSRCNWRARVVFSNDLRLLPEETTQIVVGEDEYNFYSSVAKYRDGFEVIKTPTAESVVVTREVRTEMPSTYQVTRIITNARSSEADRLYVMQRTQ